MNLKFCYSVIILLALGCGQNNKNDKKNQPDKNKTESTTGKDANSKPTDGVFDIKAAKIVYNYTDGQETGTETLYFDDYGVVAVMIVDRKSKYTRVNQTVIWKDKKSTIINHENKTVAKSSFRPKVTEPPAMAATNEKTRKNIGYEKLADETIGGKKCEVWFNTKQNFKYCVWNKIALKEALGTSIVREAVSVEEISEIPASVMEIPKNYKQ